MPQTPVLLSIQYLRGLAALGVVVHHTNWTPTGLGASGVDLFFVISGFIMAYVGRDDQTPLAFLRARALRVVPLYWIVTLLTVAERRMGDLPHIAQSLVFWPHVGPDGPGYPVVIVGWTLNFEAFFYAIFALSLLLAPAKRLAALTLALAALGVAGAILHPGVNSPTSVVSSLLLEFLAGIWLCRAWRRGLLRSAAPLLPLGLALLAAQLGLAQEPTTWRWLVWGVPAALVVAGALGLEASGRLPRLAPLLVLGNASYALYLTHVLVLHAFRPALLPLPAVVALPIVVAACIAAGWLLHAGVEKPATRWLSSRLGAGRARLRYV